MFEAGPPKAKRKEERKQQKKEEKRSDLIISTISNTLTSGWPPDDPETTERWRAINISLSLSFSPPITIKNCRKGNASGAMKNRRVTVRESVSGGEKEVSRGIKAGAGREKWREEKREESEEVSVSRVESVDRRRKVAKEISQSMKEIEREGGNEGRIKTVEWRGLEEMKILWSREAKFEWR